MVKYPMGQGPRKPFKQKQKSKVNYGSRGMSLEDRLNKSNEYYQTQNIAVIHKKPTPVQVVRVDYPKRSAARITEAYYRHASTTDYNGVYQGYYIDFEAKETKNKSSFPLSNLPEHQRLHMLSCIEQGGIAFLIISFSELDEIYLLPYQLIHQHIKKTDKQSLTYDFINKHGYKCPTGLFPMVDYLKALDEHLLNIN